MICVDNILNIKKYTSDMDAVIFDLDDTLYSEKEYVRSGYEAIAECFPEVQDMAEKLWKVFEKGGKALDVVFDEEGIIDRKAEALQIFRFHSPKIELYPGVKEMLAQLRHQGKKLGIITDGRPEGQNAKIEVLELRNLVDEIIITDELGGIAFRKPNKKAYQVMQGLMNIPFEKMCYIGDNIQKDFLAAEMLGMKSIYYRNICGLYYDKEIVI